jgi:2-C-methyl-D-erythritol 4-phosphate cytidylyltransferase/2-C-methyl-D-erythritol 2,4-cyclodiphosphate synthase
MSVYAAILAAGSGTRFGADKVSLVVRGKPIWKWSYDSLYSHKLIKGVGIVCSPEAICDVRAAAPEASFVVAGGSHRMESSRIALNSMPGDAEIILVQDAARPYVDSEVVERLVVATQAFGAAAPTIGIPDTIRQIQTDEPALVLNRDLLRAMQTPQAAKVELLRKGFSSIDSNSVTDEMSLVEAGGIVPELVEGHPDSFKITLPSDLARFALLLGPPEVRTGLGYDVHRFSSEASRKLMLGGIHFPGELALDGHSDADAVLHAIVDALLGAAGLGDIGVHFPNTDARWQGEPSVTFLQYAGKLLKESGWKVQNIDVTVVAESPKVMGRAREMRELWRNELGLAEFQVNLKATTNEGIGAIGRSEGIAAYAVATIVQFP